MVYILVILIILALSIWLWGQETVKTVIKWVLGLSIVIIMIVWADSYSKQKEEKNEQLQSQAKFDACVKKRELAYEAFPDCARYITSYEDEKKNNCKINWSLQNDEGIKGKQEYDTDKEIGALITGNNECQQN